MQTLWMDLIDAQHRHAGKRYKTRVIEGGSGPAVIMMHGTGGHAEAFARNFPGMCKDYHLYSIDSLWHGQSERPEFTGKTLEAWVDQVIDLMDAEGIDQAHLEGESMGGWIALYVALAHPDRVKSLVLNTTGGVKLPAELLDTGALDKLRESSIAVLDNPTMDLIRTRLEWVMAAPERVTDELASVRLHYYLDPEVNAALRKVYATQLNPVFRDKYELSEEQLKGIKCPVLVLWTEKNPHRGPDAGRAIADLIPNAEFYCIQDAAHWPQWEKPEEHDRVVRAFFEKCP